MLYRVAQLRLRPGSRKGVAQIMPAGWVVQAPAVSGALSKAKPHGLTWEGWGDHTTCAQGKEQARSLVKVRGKSPTTPLVIKARYEYQSSQSVCVLCDSQRKTSEGRNGAHHEHPENVM